MISELSRNFSLEWYQRLKIFGAALVGSLLLMASGFFIGTLGIDDEINALTTVFDGTGRGLWAHHLITILLPGRLGVTFAPMFLGCILYAISITIVIDLWGPVRKEASYVSAALIGGFPYFASMMTFDVVQVAYPAGFVLISASLIPIFNGRRLITLGLSVVAFAVSFACYQGVAISFATAWASIIGMRYLLSDHRQNFLVHVMRSIIPKTLSVGLLGSLFYLLTVKISQFIIPHSEWGDNYKVKTSFLLSEPGRLTAIVDNASRLLLGASGDLPAIAVFFLFLGIAVSAIWLLCDRSLDLPLRVCVTLAFLSSILILPFWILFIQSMLLSPRSSVGLGILYGYIYAFLVEIVRRSSKKRLLTGLAVVILTTFIFTGNEMYYAQMLASQADQVTVTRIAARIDSVAGQHQLKAPIPVTFIGRYAPAGRIFARYDTLGASPLDWDDGNVHRQAALFRMFGVDGIEIDTHSSLREEVGNYVIVNNVPFWPAPGSVFLYKDYLVVVNLGFGR